MIKDLKSFIVRLQNSDEATKKRWLIIFSSAATIIIVVLWAAYLNYTVLSVEGSANTLVAGRPTIFKIFTAGFSVVGKKTETGLANSLIYFNKRITSENKLTIDRSNHNFILESLDPLPIRQLP